MIKNQSCKKDQEGKLIQTDSNFSKLSGGSWGFNKECSAYFGILSTLKSIT